MYDLGISARRLRLALDDPAAVTLAANATVGALNPDPTVDVDLTRAQLWEMAGALHNHLKNVLLTKPTDELLQMVVRSRRRRRPLVRRSFLRNVCLFRLGKGTNHTRPHRLIVFPLA